MQKGVQPSLTFLQQPVFFVNFASVKMHASTHFQQIMYGCACGLLNQLIYSHIMTNLTSKQKKEWARQLYLDGTQVFTQQEIAEKVGISRKTLSKWVVDEKWNELRISITMTKEQSIKRLHKQLEDLLFIIETRPMGERHATPDESSTISKLTTAIEKLETEVGVQDVIQVSIKVIEFVKKYDMEKAKEIADIFDQFIKSLL